MPKTGPLVLLALVLCAAGLARPAAPAAAQGAGEGAAQAAQPCTFERCGLRFQGTTIFQGLQDERVGGLPGIYADLRILETAGDSAAHLARIAAYAHERAALARSLSTIALLPLYAFYIPRWHEDRDFDNAAVWTHIGLGVTGVTLAILGSHWATPVDGSLSRAIWWYNRDVVAGAVDGAPPELPPLDPDDFARSGILWGATLGMIGGIIISRDDLERGPALFELVALPLAGAGLGWVFGRGVERR